MKVGTFLLLITPLMAFKSRVQLWTKGFVEEEETEFAATEEHSTGPSALECGIPATSLSWVNMYCLEDGICEVSNYSEPLHMTSQGMEDPRECYSRNENLYIDCVTNEGTVVQDQQYKGPTSGVNCSFEKCNQGTFDKPEASSCSSPFHMIKGIGCFAYVSANMTWCQARKYCQDLGGDLASFENVTDVSDLWTVRENLNNLMGTLNSYEFAFIGLRFVDGQWTWITGNVMALDVIQSGAWTILESPAAGLVNPFCASRYYGILPGWKLSSKCEACEYNFICELRSTLIMR